MFHGSIIISYSTRVSEKTTFREAELFLKNDPRFEALADDEKLRKDLFEDYVTDTLKKVCRACLSLSLASCMVE